jgi:hypothetical protein
MDNQFSLDLKAVPKELLLIIEVLKNENIEKLEKRLKELSTGIDWKLFIELSMHHRVYSLLYSVLKNVDDTLIPCYVIKTLYQHYKINTFQMLHLCAEMENINNLLKDKKIRTLFLKGPVLALELYGDLSLRTSCDLDILISIKDIEKVEEILFNSGYQKDEYILSILGDWKWRHHHFTYYHPIKKIKLEVHWRLNPGPGREPNFNNLWKRKRMTANSSTLVYFLGEEDLLFFLTTHGARHGWSRLRWLKDIDLILKKGIDSKKAAQLFKKYHYQPIGGEGILLSSQLLNSPIDEDLELLTSSDRPKKLAQEAIFYLKNMVNLHTDPIPEEVSRYHKRHLISLMSNQQRFFFLLSCLHPYPTDVKTLPLPKGLHFLYFLLRPFLWAWRKTRHHALS